MYTGETFDVPAFHAELTQLAVSQGFNVERLLPAGPAPIVALTRAPQQGRGSPAPRLYISAGIHGDEPAGPLALLELFKASSFSTSVDWCLFPLLNPEGMQLRTRANGRGIDLNRDYRDGQTPEVRAHLDWFNRHPACHFDLALCLHEDWESRGFYLYEVNLDHEPQPCWSALMLEAAAAHCPIDTSPLIEGFPAERGVIRPSGDVFVRPDWPEALYLARHHTRRCYTTEAPSALDLARRVRATTAALQAALSAVSAIP